ncbi:MAG TPA: hypothetical protein VL285_15105 [Bryobacteraceae bacterium]|jgi:hypothetical protein|nr:hypothetical protein [Bryobacteraceae bacterium]
MRRLPLLALLLAISSARWGRSAEPAPHFQTSDRCFACHNGLSTSSGEDISIGFDWRASMMANSSRDPYWQASVRREALDHPESRAVIEDECSLCHMPMSRYESRRAGREGQVFAHLSFDSGNPADRLAADGVSCSLCHQISKDKLGSRESFVGGFVINPASPEGGRPVYGPFKIDAGHTRIMRSSSGGFRPTESEHIRQSEVCATCHTLFTKALGPGGKVIGELPEQMPYQEWLHSEYREKKSCQSCHMPVIKEDVRITRVLGEPRKGVSRHVFVAGNFFLQRMLNRYREDLNVAALPAELDSAAGRTVAYLQSEAARLTIDRAAVRNGRLEVDVAVQNLGGHKLPTAYPSRRVWLHVVVRDRSSRTVFESGALDPRGSIQGNDNDADAGRFEPHYTEISRGDQVQIYESIMGDPDGKVTTALLSAVRYLKDNRLLPAGFDKSSAHQDIAVHGSAFDDRDFIGAGDRVRYLVPLGDAQGPFRIDVELWFQPIGFRWAENLRPYAAEETRRFSRFYDSMASASAVMLASQRVADTH